MITAKLICDSISHDFKRISTFELVYPRYIHAELMTHRVFSRNAASSRAIPVKEVMRLVQDEPVRPIWTQEKSGMQGNIIEDLELINRLNQAWYKGAGEAVKTAAELQLLGAHKQNANRVLEPFQHIKVIVTATEYENWFNLRYHADAQPEIQELAKCMAAEMFNSKPNPIAEGEWHLPYIDAERWDECKEYAESNTGVDSSTLHVAKMVSASCCAQVSYRTLDFSIKKAVAIYNKLVGSTPIHASPFEHQAVPSKERTSNFIGWKQFRQEVESLGMM